MILLTNVTPIHLIKVLMLFLKNDRILDWIYWIEKCFFNSLTKIDPVISLWILPSFRITRCLEWEVKPNAPTTVPGSTKNITSASFPPSKLMGVFFLGKQQVSTQTRAARESGELCPWPDSPMQGLLHATQGVAWGQGYPSTVLIPLFIVSGPQFSEMLVNFLKSTW